ncbi:hypothetical protein DOY81_006442 [Sarcophaga bullata]|nr:hypothetical protein DOY81_006442 [Sarcophaga bullata]
MCENSSWQAPLWLTDSYLEDVLKIYLNDDKVKIQNVDIKPATANGDNYASVMSRIKVKFIGSKQRKEPEEVTFIMKYSYESDPFVAKIMAGYDVYNTEMKMYEKILPQLADILQQVGDTEKLFAKTLKVDFDKSAIIFEDLTVRNYVLADRLKGLDNVHACMVMKKLAKFHAAAAVLNQKLNGELEKFDHGIFNRHTRAFGVVFEYLIEICAKFALKSNELGAYYHDKLIKLKPHVVDYGTRAYNSNPKHFYTLCHGDLWVNNMMMLYDSQSPKNNKSLKDVLLIDFQLCNWSSPAVDLHYFLHTSLEPSLQLDVHAIDGLVQCYHTTLASTLRMLNYNGYIPTLHELQVQLLEGKILALSAATVNQPIMINDQCKDADFHSLIDDDERGRNFRNKLYENKRLQNNLKVLLPYFDQLGLLDVQK